MIQSRTFNAPPKYNLCFVIFVTIHSNAFQHSIRSLHKSWRWYYFNQFLQVYFLTWSLFRRQVNGPVSVRECNVVTCKSSHEIEALFLQGHKLQSKKKQFILSVGMAMQFFWGESPSLCLMLGYGQLYVFKNGNIPRSLSFPFVRFFSCLQVVNTLCVSQSSGL